MLTEDTFYVHFFVSKTVGEILFGELTKCVKPPASEPDPISNFYYQPAPVVIGRSNTYQAVFKTKAGMLPIPVIFSGN